MKDVRTKGEREAAVERLRVNKANCNRYNYFGEDNHQHIDVMIDVIENERSEDWIYDTYPSCDELGEESAKEHAKFVSAMTAKGYLVGENELEDILYPEKY